MPGEIGGLSVREGEAPHVPAAEVTVEVAPLGRGNALTAVDESTRDRAAVIVAVFRHRQHQMAARIRLLCLVAGAPLEDVPTVVLEPGALQRGVVDLLPLPLADVADPEVAGLPVE